MYFIFQNIANLSHLYQLINGGVVYINLVFQAGSSFMHEFISFNRDEGVHWGIQNGLYLSRSTVVYFKHNNMDSLREREHYFQI